MLSLLGALGRRLEVRLVMLRERFESHVNVLPGSECMITIRPRQMFHAGRLFIHDGDRWLVDDLKIGNCTTFLVRGPILGSDFDDVARITERVNWAAVMSYHDVVIAVRYVGPEEDGEPFYAELYEA